ncbi:hypothetical protein ACWHLZ_30915 [Streptomyces chartreusis]
MNKQESVMTAGGSDTTDLVHEMASGLHFCGNAEGLYPQGHGDGRAGRLQERVAWLTLAGVALQFFLPFLAPSPTAEEKVQVNVSVVVVENHSAVNPGYSVPVQAKEGMAK